MLIWSHTTEKEMIFTRNISSLIGVKMKSFFNFLNFFPLEMIFLVGFHLLQWLMILQATLTPQEGRGTPQGHPPCPPRVTSSASTVHSAHPSPVLTSHPIRCRVLGGSLEQGQEAGQVRAEHRE